MNMDRRKFLKISAITTGVVVIGGGAICIKKRDSNILDDHFDGT